MLRSAKKGAERELEGLRGKIGVLEKEHRNLLIRLGRANLNLKMKERELKSRTSHTPQTAEASTTTETLEVWEDEPGLRIEETMLVFKPNFLEEVDEIVQRRLKEFVGGLQQISKVDGNVVRREQGEYSTAPSNTEISLHGRV